MDERQKYKRKIPFSVQGILNNISSNIECDSNDFSLKTAFFNGVAIVIVIIVLFTTSCVYYILYPFVKPLLWALLCGSALHPFKYSLALKFKSILNSVESPEKNTYSLIFWPFHLLINVSDIIGVLFFSYIKFFISCAIIVIGIILIYFYIPFLPTIIVKFMYLLEVIVKLLLHLFSSSLIVGSLLLTFLCSLALFWQPKLINIHKFGSFLVWIAITAYFCGLFPFFSVPLFLFLQSSVFGCCIYSVIKRTTDEAEISSEKTSPSEEDKTKIETKLKTEEEIKLKNEVETHISMKYIRCVAFACGVVVLFHLPYFLIIIPAGLVVVHLLKILVVQFGIAHAVSCQLELLEGRLAAWFYERRALLVPPVIEDLLKMIQKGFDKFISGLKTCCDSAAAVAVILGLLLFVFFVSFFLAVQAYREGVYLVQTGGSIINSTIVHNPELHHLLPEDWESTLDTALNNTYIYIREALANLLRGLLKDKGISAVRAAELERNVLDLWDRAYQAWVVPLQPNKLSEVHGPSVTAEAVRHSFERFVDGLKGTPEVASLESVSQIVSDNMATLTSSLDSVWMIVKGNMTLLVSLLSACFSLLFGGSLSLINFIFHMIVFLTALFYLLSTSREMYKPVELITSVSPTFGNKLAVAVENACQGVLAASAKLSLFYGLWTWLIHTLFQCNFVYMPALFAAVMGVVPALGSYTACIPAVLDLWLVKDSKLLALGLTIAQFLPTFIVDSTIYNEMKGGHPYLTGLSVAGGIFWLGLEGAIIGPLLLCFLFVILNIIGGITHGDDSPHPPNSS